jgi:hypothetical protein
LYRGGFFGGRAPWVGFLGHPRWGRPKNPPALFTALWSQTTRNAGELAIGS